MSRNLIPTAVFVLWVAVAAPARADLNAAITADTSVTAHYPTFNFNGGRQGGAEIRGNDPGGAVGLYFTDGPSNCRGVNISCYRADATILQFELPILPAGESVTGVRLRLWDGEGFDTDVTALVGWLTGDVPLMRKISYMDLAPPGFTGGIFNFDAIDQVNDQIKFDPAKVQFASNADSAEDVMALFVDELPIQKRPSAFAPYEDLTVADGLAQYVASQIDANQTQTIHLFLAPASSINTTEIALIHGIDAATPTSDIRLDIIGTPGLPIYFPQLEILTTGAGPVVPEPASVVLLAVGLAAVLGRRQARSWTRCPGRTPLIAVLGGGLALILAAAPAQADVDALLIGETYVDATYSGNNFAGGVQGAGRIPGHALFDPNLFTKGRHVGNGSSIAGNEIGALLHWEIFIDVMDVDERCQHPGLVSPCGLARAAVFKFQLPALPAGEVVSGVRLNLFDTEELSDRPLSADVGWITADVPILPFITFEDLGPPGFSSNFNGGNGAMDEGNQTIMFDPAKVQFAPASERMNLQIADGSEVPDAYPVYEDNTTGDGLAQYVAATMDPNQTTIIHVVLSPQGDTEFQALIHGTDSATWNAQGTVFGDANNDAQVTGADLISVQQNFGNDYTPAMRDCEGMGLGDANDDCLVTGLDLITVQQRFGKTGMTFDEIGNPADPQFEPVLQVLTQPASAPVPEPATAIVAAAGILLGTGSRRHSRRSG